MKTPTLLLLAALLAPAALAQHNHGSHGSPAPAASAQPAAQTAAPAALTPASGEVRRVNAAGGEITLRHGEIKNLDMPPMTMVFKVPDKALLDKVKAGDKVSFTATQINGAYTVMSIEPQP